MGRQETDWGDIEWLEEKKENGENLRTGIVTLAVGGHQPRHIHFEEQVVYVLQGEARSIINGKESRMEPGAFFHWKAGVRHEVFNTGKVPLKHLLISNPMREETGAVFPAEKAEKTLANGDGNEAGPDLIYTAIEAIRTQFLDALHYGYVIFDSLGNLILQSRYMPEYCETCCKILENPGRCPCMAQVEPGEWNREQTFYCPEGLEVFHFPIFFRQTFLGYIQGGYIRHKGKGDEKLKELYDVPESVVQGIRGLMKRITKAIRSYCEFEQFRKDLLEKELKLLTNEAARQALLKNLQETQSTVTELKINHHFLFNTLNSMASMALDGGSMSLYQSIVDLSRMFHYTLRSQNSIVPLAKEVEYVNAYLQLQKLRFGEELEIIREICPEALNMQVPFNFLQPVTENMFTHGFDDRPRKRIWLRIGLENGYVRIRAANSGKKLSAQEIERINREMKNGGFHGLSMIYRKLQAAFGAECVFEITRQKDGNTCFVITFPARKGESL